MYGSQKPTRMVSPPSESSHGDRMAALMDKAGFPLLDWQRRLADSWLSLSGSGEWAAPLCGASVPRQNGKTRLVAGIIAWHMVAYGSWVVYTSHLQKTSTETFDEVRAIFESDTLRPYVRVVKTALGREEIILHSGAKAKFLARTRNGGRGQHADLFIADEGQTLDDNSQSSFLPMLAASKRPQTIIVGTPPDENEVGDVFKGVRARALAGAGGISWAEWSVDEIGDVSDRGRWAETNPSLGYLIKESTVASEVAQMPRDKFARERLGWWSSERAGSVRPISAASWDACRVDKPRCGGSKSFGVKFGPDGRRVSVSVCLDYGMDAPRYIELVMSEDASAGTQWLADWMAERWHECAAIVVDGASNAEDFTLKLRDAGVGRNVIMRPRTCDVMSACSGLASDVLGGAVEHGGSGMVDACVLCAEKRPIGKDGGWGFASGATDDGAPGDATVPESLAMALWGAKNAKRKPGRKLRIA